MCKFMIIVLKLRALHEKECKHIICSEFPRHMEYTKPGREGVRERERDTAKASWHIYIRYKIKEG